MSQFIVQEPEPVYGNEPRTLEEAIKQGNEWKEKYYALMEKYLRCVEK